MTRLPFCAVLFFALANASASAPSDYAYVFPIQTAAPASGDNSAWRVDLGPDVYRWVQDPDLRDVEIFNADKHPVPFARIAVGPTATASENSAPLPILELPSSIKATGASDLRLVIDRDADGRLRRIDAGEQTPAATATKDWVVDASAFDHAIDSLILTWRDPASGVVARFAVDASDDLQAWRSVGSATVLKLEQQGARLERHDIALGGTRAKYLRLRRLDDGAALTGLAVEARSIERGQAAPARIWIDAAAKPASSDDKVPAGITRFEYTLPARLPIESARIELASDNALAPISLFAHVPEATAMPWARLGGLTAFRLRQGEDTLRNGDLDVRAGVRMQEFRIESPTAISEPPHLSLGYRPDSLVFLAEGSGPFVLAVGSVEARHAEYPVELALASIRAKLGKDWQPPLASLGRGEASAGDTALHAAPPPFPWRRWLLWAILVGGAILIAALALSLLRGAKPPE